MNEIIIGNQIWSDTELNYNDGGEGIIIKKYPTRNGIGLGTVYYYNRAALIRLMNSFAGWKVPSKQDFDDLITYVSNDDYSVASKLLTNPYTSFSVNYGSIVPNNFNAKLAGTLTNYTLTDNTNKSLSRVYTESNGSSEIIQEIHQLGLQASYWTSNMSNVGELGKRVNYYNLKPKANYKGNYYEDTTSDNVYIPIRLIKVS